LVIVLGVYKYCGIVVCKLTYTFKYKWYIPPYYSIVVGQNLHPTIRLGCGGGICNEKHNTTKTKIFQMGSSYNRVPYGKRTLWFPRGRGGDSMNTEDVPLNIKEIFDKKRILYHPHDIAQMRYLCRKFIDFLLECERKRSSPYDRYEDLSKQGEWIYKTVYPPLKSSVKDDKNDLQETIDSFILKRYNEQLSYPQDWSSYDKAKTNQDIFFKKLLHELLFLSVKDKSNRGYSIKDKLFAMCIKVFYKSDLRKCQSILKELKNLNYINKVPCYKSIDNFFNDKDLTKLLDDLIFISSLPLANIEHTGAIDSTGFSISRFENWNNYKWGTTEGKERVWRKAHASMGCTSNIFLSVEITPKNVGDAPMFEKVVGKRTQYFEMKNFVADKAYSSRNIVRFIYNLGMNPYIPFRSNATGRSKGVGEWVTLFQKFKNQNALYMKKYHQRSNIESGFHMVKTRFGDHLMTRNYVANVNEIKVKFLCHNIMVLIQETYERDIKIDLESCVKRVSS